jgi:RNA polymerase sigma-70 factor (ECF subfamily)
MTPKFQDKSNWMVAFRDGNGDTFKEVFKEHHRALCYLAEKYGLDKEEAEDIVADTFTKLWHGRSQFSDEGHIKGFLRITTRNACVNLLKQKQRRANSNNELLYLMGDREEDFFRKLVDTELIKKLYPYIEQLPRKCRAVFEQVYFEGASTEEAANKLGISTRNVLNQKARALQLLKGKIFLLTFLYCFIVTYPTLGAENKKHENLFCQKAHTCCLY